MSFFEAIFLGLIQGITEFFPVSSSGHLVLFQKLLGFNNLENYMFFDLVCHLGTLLAVGIVFADEIKKVFKDKKRVLQILLGTLPLFPLVLILKPLKSIFNDPQYLGFFFLLTALLLFLGEKISSIKAQPNPYRDALKIGCFQALAILPGVSRSGSTISCAKILGWNVKEALSFSFLLSIPAILGGMVLETFQMVYKQSFPAEIPLYTYFAGFLTAFFIGWMTLKLLIRIAIRDKFQVFIWYTFLMGLFTIILFRLPNG